VAATIGPKGDTGSLIATTGLQESREGWAPPLAWHGGTEDFRGRRAHDTVIVQRHGDTLLLDQVPPTPGPAIEPAALFVPLSARPCWFIAPKV